MRQLAEAIVDGRTSILEYAAATTTGACRDINQDAFGVFERAHTFLVVDGCGGAAHGDSPARRTVESFAQVVEKQLHGHGSLLAADPLAVAILRANAEVHRGLSSNPAMQGMGATLCAVRASRGWIAVAHVGDCRVGLLRDNAFAWLTQDHSLVADMHRSGAPRDLIDEIAATHASVVTRAIGLQEQVSVELSYHATRAGDVYLLCSDGLTDQVDSARIAEVVGAHRSVRDRCAALLEASEQAGGHDNATAILLQMLA